MYFIITVCCHMFAVVLNQFLGGFLYEMRVCCYFAPDSVLFGLKYISYQIICNSIKMLSEFAVFKKKYSAVPPLACRSRWWNNYIILPPFTVKCYIWSLDDSVWYCLLPWTVGLRQTLWTDYLITDFTMSEGSIIRSQLVTKCSI